MFTVQPNKFVLSKIIATVIRFHVAHGTSAIFHITADRTVTGVGHLAEELEMCSLLPAVLHLTAHCGCSFLFHYFLQYLQIICYKKKNALRNDLQTHFSTNCLDKYIAFSVTASQQKPPHVWPIECLLM